MNAGIRVMKWLGRRSRCGSILADRLTSHHTASAAATTQSARSSDMVMKNGDSSSVNELTALSSLENARKGWRQAQRLPSARRSLRQVLRDQRRRCLKKLRRSGGKVDHTRAE